MYWSIITSENRFLEVELFYVWLFPEQYEKTGVDTLLIGVRTRFQISENRDSLNTGESTHMDKQTACIQSGSETRTEDSYRQLSCKR